MVMILHFLNTRTSHVAFSLLIGIYCSGKTIDKCCLLATILCIKCDSNYVPSNTFVTQAFRQAFAIESINLSLIFCICNVRACTPIFFFEWLLWEMVQIRLWPLQNPYKKKLLLVMHLLMFNIVTVVNN